MKYKRLNIFHQLLWLLAVPVLLGGLLLTAGLAQAQRGGTVQELTGQVDESDGAFYTLPALKKGQTVYVYVQGISGNLDPSIALADAGLDRDIVRDDYRAEVQQALASGREPLLVIPEVAGKFFLAWNDDHGTGHDAALQFAVPANGDYKLAVISSPARPTWGHFRLLVGLDAPEVLTGEATPNSDTIAVIDTENTRPGFGIQEITGTLTLEDPETFFNLNEVKAGDTLYAYIETTSGDLKPMIALQDFSSKDLATANFAGQQSSASLEYPFRVDGGGYRLGVTAASSTSGDFRLLLGLNAPEALTGQAVSQGRAVARLPIEVGVGLKLQQITSVDQKSENYGAVATLQMQWQDPTLAFNPDDCQCRFKSYRGDSFSQYTTANNIVWPDFTLYNQQGNRWTQNRTVVVWPDGLALYLERFSTTFQAPDFDFRHFPFDKQDFYMRVDAIFPEEFFIFKDLVGFTEVGDQLGEEEWYITHSDTSVTSEATSTQFVSSRYSFHFEARRHLSFYLFRIFVPVLIIIIVSWTTFFLKDYGKRVDVASANLLLFIAFNFTIANDLPRLGYLTFMDIILVSTFIVTSLVVIFNVYLKRLEVIGKENFANTIDNYMIWVYPLGYFAAFVLVWLFFAGGMSNMF